ncbi:MAG: septal ring lytic transglycosylase RlpA family protein [Azospirillaceae bacterium]
MAASRRSGRLAGLAVLAAAGLALSACAETQLAAHMAARNAAKSDPHYKVGSPYTINGRRYEPRESFDYVETGVASWYGPGFAGKQTANGEIFDPNALTAAHPTLQLPSIARVTNLENGRSVEVRINDRGPFASDRLIDLSRRAAELLGFKGQGTAVVRVQVDTDRSLALRAELTGEPRAPAAAPRQPVVVAAASAPPSSPSSSSPSSPSAVMPVEAPRALVPASNAILEPPRAQGQTSAPAPARLAPPPERTEGRLILASATTPEPAPAPSAGATTGADALYVQVGAFTRRSNADSLRAGLAPLGPVDVSPITLDGVAYYRVRLGPLSDTRSAETLLARVRDAGHEAARLVGR